MCHLPLSLRTAKMLVQSVETNNIVFLYFLIVCKSLRKIKTRTCVCGKLDGSVHIINIQYYLLFLPCFILLVRAVLLAVLLLSKKKYLFDNQIICMKHSLKFTATFFFFSNQLNTACAFLLQVSVNKTETA